MRVKSTLINTSFSIISFILLILLEFINRKVFINFLGIDYIGFEGLFNNILALLNLAELGVGTAIIYNLYNPIAHKDKQKIAELMSIYKKVYHTTGVIIAVFGLILMPFIHYLIKGDIVDIGFIRTIFLLQLTSTVSTYFFADKRALILAEQKEYISIISDTLIRLTFTVLQIIVLIMLRNYIIYLLLKITSTILSNIIIGTLCNKKYPYIKVQAKYKKGLMKKYHLLDDLKALSIHKVSEYIFGGTDNIVIAYYLGISYVGMFSNYNLILSTAVSMCAKVITPCIPSLGNFVYDKNNSEDTEKLLFRINFIAFMFASFSTVALACLIDNFIILWLGSGYVLSFTTSILFIILAYIMCFEYPIYTIYNVLGLFRYDQMYVISAAIVNVTLSIALVRSLQLNGILIGTICGHLIYLVNRVCQVYIRYFKKFPTRYLIKQFIFLITTIGQVSLAVFLIRMFFHGNDIYSFMAKCIICIILPNLINIILFWKWKESHYFRSIFN